MAPQALREGLTVGRRARTTTFHCAEPGCREVGIFEYDNQRELSRICRNHANWKCVRHGAGKAVLAADNRVRSCVLVVTVLPHLPDHRFWIEEGKTTGSGFTHGPGFQAHAQDFPPGTRLTVTATLELAEAPSPGPEGGR